MAAADYAAATIAVSSSVYSFVIPSIVILITSLVMLRQLFSKAADYFGVVGAIVGIVYGTTVFMPALSILYIVSNLLFAIWYLLAGSSLYRLRARPS